MKSLLHFLNDYKKESVLAPLFKLAESMMDLLVPLIVAFIINEGISKGHSPVILTGFFLLLLFAAAGLCFAATAQWYAAKASVGFATLLRKSLFVHIQSLSYAELDQIGSDTLITRITSDLALVQNGVNLTLRLLLRSPFIVFGAMALAFTVDFHAALIFAGAIPVLSLVIFIIMRLCVPLYAKVQTLLDRLLCRTRENLTGVRVIRAFRKESDEVSRFDAENMELTRMNLFVGKISALMNPMTFALINIAAILLIQTGALRVNAGAMRQGDVVALYNYMAQIIIELIKLANLIVTINKALASGKRIESVFALQPSVQYKDNEVNASDTAAAACFQNVSFSYPGAKEEALGALSFSLNQGETLGIIGGTGSGKSTLVSLLCRFYDADSGQITLFGNDITLYSKEQLTGMIGLVPQNAILFAGSIRDNMQIGNPDADDASIWAALEMAQASEIIRQKEGMLDFPVEQNGRNLSGGQKQRLTIARALVKNPKLLILDDSSSALDFATDFRLRSAIHKLHGRMTTVIVSQRTSSVRSADRILVLEDGRIAGTGTHEELLSDCSIYREIHFSQNPEDMP